LLFFPKNFFLFDDAKKKRRYAVFLRSKFFGYLTFVSDINYFTLLVKRHHQQFVAIILGKRKIKDAVQKCFLIVGYTDCSWLKPVDKHFGCDIAG